MKEEYCPTEKSDALPRSREDTLKNGIFFALCFISSVRNLDDLVKDIGFLLRR